MASKILLALVFGSISICRRVFGLLLVLAAVSGMASTAVAKTPVLNGVPETNAGTMVSALALLIGGVLLLTDRYRQR